MRRVSPAADIAVRNYLSHLHTAHSITLPPSAIDLLHDYIATLIASRPALAAADTELVLPLQDLLTSSIPRALTVSTGLSTTRTLAAAIAAARHEVLFATCFWAPSASLQILGDALRTLSRAGRGVRVRIGFSSRTLLQKLTHTTSWRGHNYAPDSWQPTLGLPSPRELDGIDLRVKSIFYLPFSVLHSKFVIIDRQLLLLPSSNVSWEVWLEQCTVFHGDIVTAFLEFWRKTWPDNASDLHPPPPPPPQPASSSSAASPVSTIPDNTEPLNPEGRTLPTLFLPHPHHRNPRFSPLSFLARCMQPRRPPPPPPVTPMTAFVLHLLAHAARSVYLHSPNLTAEPILAALAAALGRGVHVQVVTVRNMMRLEQIVTTAGTAITETCVTRLAKADRGGRGERRGELGVWYYSGAAVAEGVGEEEEGGRAEEAVKSHVKALVVDGEVTVVGSANADRASWWTSQEVNVAVFDTQFAAETRRRLVKGLGGRVERVVGMGDLGEVEEEV